MIFLRTLGRPSCSIRAKTARLPAGPSAALKRIFPCAFVVDPIRLMPTPTLSKKVVLSPDREVALKTRVLDLP